MAASQGHVQVYGASPPGGPVPVLECQKGDWEQPAGVTSSILCLMKLIAFPSETDDSQGAESGG